jgi:hypothetical protein
MAKLKEPPLLWQTHFLQKVVVALMLLLSVAALGHLFPHLATVLAPAGTQQISGMTTYESKSN